MNTEKLGKLNTKREQIARNIAALQRERADLSIEITQLWQAEIETSADQPEEGSSVGSEPPDSAHTDKNLHGNE